MGRNAQARRAQRDEARANEPAQVTRPALEQTHTMRVLATKMAALKTHQQFEEIIASAHPDSRQRMRELLEPLVPDKLPCCGRAMLSARLGEAPIHHGRLCQNGRLVRLT